MNAYALYRYTHADGTAKEWAYRDLGNGQAEIRWGPENQLRQSQVKPIRVANGRAEEKLRKGYRSMGTVWLDAHGSRTNPPKSPVTPVDRSALLGEGDGFYF